MLPARFCCFLLYLCASVVICIGFWRTMLSMIAKDLLEILVCPACKQALDYRENPESLKCRQCHRVYAVKDDIPIMLVDEATIESA
jgi:uncharacterized protein YbaR (Trm112 family)